MASGSCPRATASIRTGSWLGHAAGYVGVDNKGLGGIERTTTQSIRGNEARCWSSDRREEARVQSRRAAADRRRDLELTIDAYLQHVVERELAVGIAENRAEGGVAIVMDPWTGEILAMASEPTSIRTSTAMPTDTAAEPRGRGHLRARLDLQDRHRVGGARRSRADPGDADRRRARLHRHRPPRVHDMHPTRHADLHRRDREVQQRRRDPHGLQARRRAAERFVRRFGFGTRMLQELPAESAGNVWSN